MKPFSIVEHRKGQELTYDLIGYFSENATLPALVQPVIKINLSQIVGINSYGIRGWCRWLTSIPKDTKVILLECPFCVVKSFNSVFGMLNQQIEVHSFYVPYYDDDSGVGQKVLYKKDKNYSGLTVTHPIVTDAKNKALAMDVTDSYFDFLKLTKS